MWEGQELANGVEDGHSFGKSPLIYHAGRGVPQEDGGRDAFYGCGIYIFGDIGQRLCCCRVCHIYDTRDKRDDVPVSAGFTFGLKEVGTVVS